MLVTIALSKICKRNSSFVTLYQTVTLFSREIFPTPCGLPNLALRLVAKVAPVNLHVMLRLLLHHQVDQ